TVLGGLELDHGKVLIDGQKLISFPGSQSLSGTGELIFGSSINNAIAVEAGGSLTVGAGVTIHGVNGTVDGSAATLVNQGTIAADGGGTVIVRGVANFANGRLSGGTWQATANSTLRLLGADIGTLAASVLIDGTASHFYSDSGTTSALAG